MPALPPHGKMQPARVQVWWWEIGVKSTCPAQLGWRPWERRNRGSSHLLAEFFLYKSDWALREIETKSQVSLPCMEPGKGNSSQGRRSKEIHQDPSALPPLCKTTYGKKLSWTSPLIYVYGVRLGIQLWDEQWNETGIYAGTKGLVTTQN